MLSVPRSLDENIHQQLCGGHNAVIYCILLFIYKHVQPKSPRDFHTRNLTWMIKITDHFLKVFSPRVEAGLIFSILSLCTARTLWTIQQSVPTSNLAFYPHSAVLISKPISSALRLCLYSLTVERGWRSIVSHSFENLKRSCLEKGFL